MIVRVTRWDVMALGLCSVVLAVSCGKSEPRGEGETLSAGVKADSEEQASAQLQDASEALEAVETSGASVGAAESTEDPTLPIRTCTPSTSGDGALTVAETWDYNVEKSGAVGQLTRTTQSVFKASRQRVWTPATGGAALSCSAVQTLSMNWNDGTKVNGLKLVATVDDSSTITSTLAGSTRRGVAVELKLARNRTAKGSRTVTHSEHAGSATTTSFLRTIESSIERTESGTRKTPGTVASTESFSIGHVNATATGEPLKIRTVIDVASKEWTTKTIESGTFVSTAAAKKKRVSSTFENVVFSKGECVPKSGKITGKIFDTEAPADAAPLTTFVLTFGADTDSKVSISYDGGTAEDFPTAADYVESCSFSKGWKKASTAAAK